MAPLGLGTPGPAPGPTNVVIVSKIPEGVTEQQVSNGAGGFGAVLSTSYRPADPDGPGWAIIAFATPDLAKAARERLDGKPMPGVVVGATIEAALGEGLYGPVRRAEEGDGPWKEARTAQGQLYWYHAVSRQTSWVKPPPEFAPAAPPGMPGHLQGSIAQRLNLVPPPPAGPPPPHARPAFTPGAPPPPPAPANVPPAPPPSGEGGGVAGSGPVGANLFVYHIPNSWDDQIMRQHFEHFGQIMSCRVQRDQDGRPRGFGFVSFKDPGSASAAIAGMHGFPVDGKHLKVQLKKGDMDGPGGGPPAPPPPGGKGSAPY